MTGMKTQTGRLIILAMALAIFLTQCDKPGKIAYRYPVVKGPRALLKVSPATNSALYGADSGKWVSVPMRPNEILYSIGDNNGFFFRNDHQLPDSLAFTVRDSALVLLNGKPQALIVPVKGDRLPFFRSMQTADMQQLRSIRFAGDIPEPYLPWLDSLSRVNPHVDLEFQTDSISISAAMLTWMADHFSPRFMILELPVASMDILERFTKLESLYLMLDQDSSRGKPVILPKMESLRQLTLTRDNDSTSDWSSLFTRNPQLESLSLSDPAADILRAAAQLPSVRELYLLGNDSIRFLPHAASWKNCRVLSIENPLSIEQATEQVLSFDHLEALGLPASLSQDHFNIIMMANRHLHSLSIYAEDTMITKDYAVLRQMKDLRVLQITGKYGSVEALKPLKRLEFLSLPDKFFEDSAALDALQKDLPDTRITPNGGFCMGSGWILVFWPLTLLSLLVWKLLKPETVHP
jgi:hypothetical protein